MGMRRLSTLYLMVVALAACTAPQEESPITVYLVADGREQAWSLPAPTTVGEFLRERQIELGPLDRPSHEEFTQITDGMRITIVRVREETECEDVEIPYQRRTVLLEGLAPGAEQLGQAGKNGQQKICYRVRYEDDVPRGREETNRFTVSEPQDEVIFVGPTGEIEPAPITGTLAYINNKNAWVIRGSSTTKRPLTTSGDLDSRVFSLSSDGRLLMYTRELPETPFGNQLWLLPITANPNESPVQLVPEDLLFADWVPGRENTISYSTAEPRETAPGWQAHNDFWIMRIDPATGDSLTIDEIIEPSTGGGGFYGWWGTNYRWSPDGQNVAWIRADSIGLIDFEANQLSSSLMNYSVFNTSGNWSWRSSVSWSPDSNLLTATVHGAPLGSEAPETSPAFDIAVSDVAGSFQAVVVERAGMWAAPEYSPLVSSQDWQFPQGYLAYLRARDIGNSINNLAEYDLVVADRDGSNARTIFPFSGQPGLNAQEFVWSPDGRQIALIYRGNLYVVDVESAVAHQLTLDGGASRPAWAQ